jgi:hypothetical protein
MRARCAQVARDLAPDATEAADDVVVGQRVDHPLLAPGREHLAELTADEELGQGRERVEERTDAEDDQQHVDDLPHQGVRLGEPADRRHRVERPAERIPRSDPFREHQPNRADCK